MKSSRYRINFICHGNICRSPTAEFVMKHIAALHGCENMFSISSAAVSGEAVGLGIYPPAAKVLSAHGVEYDERKAVRVLADDYDKYDLFAVMDSDNCRRLLKIFGDDPDGKIKLLGEFGGINGDICDPWYTRDFERAFEEIFASCEGLFKKLTADSKC